jgi:hypothetical protein
MSENQGLKTVCREESQKSQTRFSQSPGVEAIQGNRPDR